MAKPVTRHWYRVALARDGKASELVAASGEHMGHAIAEAQHAIDHAWPVAVEAATGGEIPLGESVGKGHVVKLGAAPVPTGFRWPAGVLPSIGAADKLASARAGWVVRPAKDLLVIEAQPEGGQVIESFMSLVERLPAADNLEVRVLDHFEDAPTTDVWLTSRVNAKQILRFLDDHDEELFGNGHLELSVYVRKHKATLRLTEHKTIVWLAEERALEREVETWLTELHVPRVPELVTVRDAAHFHYRPAKSRDRKKLGEELFRQRLRKVATVKAKSAT
ncbi:MAG: hypothetical protein ACM31C_09395 [Acidobacteriota bacterium]